MKVLDRIIGMIGGPDEATRTRVRSIRFRRLLEDVRTILDLSADAREKLDEDFIFDQHYVTSLVDRVIDASGRLVHDACILAPDSTRTMYEALDECRRLGQDRLLSEHQWADIRARPAGDDCSEPEYEMLDRALEWMSGAASRAPSVEGLVDLAFESALEADSGEPAPSSDYMHLDTGPLHLDLLPLFEGAVGCDTGAVSEMDVGCRPLGHVLMGLPGTGGGSRWTAVVSPEHLDARSTGDEPPAHVTASLAGHEDSDFAFAADAGGALGDAKALPSFTTRKVGRWSLAWRYGARTPGLEESLVRLGSLLFTRGAGQP